MAKSKQKEARGHADSSPARPDAPTRLAEVDAPARPATPSGQPRDSAVGATTTGGLTILSKISEDLFDEEAEAFWLTSGREAVRDGTRRVEEATRQLMTIVSWAQSAYFALLSFSDIKKSLTQLGEPRKWAFAFTLISPMLCWVLSMIFAVRVFKTKSVQVRLSDPSACKEFFVESTVRKEKSLKVAHVMLIIGFALLICNVIIYMMFI